jgi:hypothetical protein
MKLAKLYQLEKYRAKAAAIERVWDSQKRMLLALPKRHGFKSVGEMIEALKIASKEGGAAVKGGPAKRRKSRAVITDKTKDAVKKAVAAGHVAKQIAHDLKISTGTVNKIKAEFGLVKRRAK